MVSHFPQLQNPIFDALYCDEDRLDEDSGLKEQVIDNPNKIQQQHQQHESFPFLSDHDLFWESEEIPTLLAKEKKQARSSYGCVESDGSLSATRNEAVGWMVKVVARCGFAAVTAVLAVNYYDRFVASACFQREKPWMSQLAAVACLSIAAKVEEIHVPALLDLQVEESKYVFEARTIQRMELLVLSTLEWRMNPVTPMSYFDHIVRRFRLITNLHWDFLRRCESVVLSIITDCRLVDYLPSVIAAATMNYVIGEIEPCDAMEYQNQLMTALQTSMETIDDCHTLILGVMGNRGHNLSRKRIYEPVPSSPSGVIDAYFSSDSSNDSWSVAPEPQLKRKRVDDQSHMRLASLSTIFVGLAKDPH